MSEGAWISVTEFPGGQVVRCKICGKHAKRTFHASDTNYAEALRLATAYAWTHGRSGWHTKVLRAYRRPPRPLSEKEKSMNAAFPGFYPEDPRARKLLAAKEASEKYRDLP